jgi:hypothetical protein
LVPQRENFAPYEEEETFEQQKKIQKPLQKLCPAKMLRKTEKL